MSKRDWLKHLGFHTAAAIAASKLTPMNKPSIEQMNEAIAIFDGWEFKAGDPKHKCPYCIGGDEPCTPAMDRFYKCGHVRFHYQLKYHESCDALMPVYHSLHEKAFEMQNEPEALKLHADINNQLLFGTLADLCFKIYQFITWLNQQTTTNEQK